MSAIWIGGAATLRAGDDGSLQPASTQPARITAGELPDDSSPASRDAASTDSPHATRLKWRAYRPHNAGAAGSASAADSVSDSAAASAADSATGSAISSISDDSQAVFSDATPLAAQAQNRVSRDPAIVRAQAIQVSNPIVNPFGDDPPQAASQLAQSPAPPATNPDTTQTPGALAPPATTPDVPEPGSTPFGPRSRFTRPGRAPAPLSPTEPLDTAPASPLQQPIGPLVNPNPSDVEDLSCTTHQAHCNQDENTLMHNTISKIGLDINEYGKQGDAIPCECTIGESVTFDQRCWPLLTYTWKASALCHKPLYFEEVQLERYGHSAGPIAEPLLSAAHFFITVPLLPYYIGVDPPLECQYTLGYYRPGDCAPYMLDPFPLSVRGAVLEAGAVVGITSVLP